MSRVFGIDKNRVVRSNSSANKIVKNLLMSNISKNNKSRNLTYILTIEDIKEPIFLTSSTKKVFNYLE